MSSCGVRRLIRLRRLILIFVWRTCMKVAKFSLGCLYSFDPLKLHFCTVKLEFTGVDTIFLISAHKQIVGIR